MRKDCKVCGKETNLPSFEDTCYSCLIKQNLKRVQEQIEANEEDVDTSSSDYVICPYCGDATETCYGYEDFPELFEDGEHTITCEECGRSFILETTISYYYKTKRIEKC